MHAFWTNAFCALAVTLLLSGLDDLIPLAIVARHRLRKKMLPPEEAKETAESRIAIFVPCWKESDVIGNMVRQNLTAIRYRNFDIFLGAYPNDEATIAVARELAKTFSNVHTAVCPNPGPTSKADCLNSILRRMQEFERVGRARFETVVLHDAEDLIHPDALALINRERRNYEMVQVPVLPLPTPFAEFTHGVYCDEFAEFQTIDMHARQYSRSFVPSNGVGTGFAREILDRLESERGEVFDAASLTEDYEIGVYIHDKGYRQLFAPLTRSGNGFVATREYFPRTAKTAIRQRTRWVTGIALQCWERRGWAGSFRTRYWFWRDRKGLVTNPLSLLTNFIFLAGIADLALSAAQHRPWIFSAPDPAVVWLGALTTLLQCVRLGLRSLCAYRIFGPAFAAGVPLRSFLANLINCLASIRAVRQFRAAKREKRKLVWQKTDHAYPAESNLAEHKRDLEEILVKHGIVSSAGLALAKKQMPPDGNLAEFLFRRGSISDDDYCRAMSLYTGAGIGHFEASQIKEGVRRCLPAHLQRQYGIVPVAMKDGRLVVVGRQMPPPEDMQTIQSYCSLTIEFQIIGDRNLAELKQSRWLSAAGD